MATASYWASGTTPQRADTRRVLTEKRLFAIQATASPYFASNDPNQKDTVRRLREKITRALAGKSKDADGCPCGAKTYLNAEVSLRTDCSGGANLGLPACVTIAAGVYSSPVDQATADSLASAKATALMTGMDTGHCCTGGPSEIGDFTWPNSGGGYTPGPGNDGSGAFTFVGTPSPGIASGSATQNPSATQSGTSIVWKQQTWCSSWDNYVATVAFDYVVTGAGVSGSSTAYLIDWDNGSQIDQGALANGSGHLEFSHTVLGNGGGKTIQIEFTANNPTVGAVSIAISNLTLRPNTPPVTSNCTVVTSTAPPANDNFASAITLTGHSGTVYGSNLFATVESGEPPTVAGQPASTSIWYNWTAPADGTATFNTWGSNYDTLLACYTGAAVNALTSIAENDDGTRPLQSNISFAATHGTTYHIRVDGYNGAEGNVTLSWSLV